MSKATKASCQVCKKELPVLALKHGDPYCSSLCCRQDLGVVFACDSDTPLRQCGTESGYNGGCHCEQCRRAACEGRKKRYRRTAAAA